MDSEVFLLRKTGKEGIRYYPVADLDCVPIPDEFGYIMADPLGSIEVVPGIVFQQWFVAGDDKVDVLNADKAVAVNSRHLPVDLSDDKTR